MSIAAKTVVVALLFTALALTASSKSTAADDAIALPTAAAWPEADKLFRNDPSWVGGDDATSVALSDDRIAWLFADSFVDPTARHKRPGSKLIRNSIGIQRGANPATATIKFHWHETDGAPSSFFAEKDKEWYWPGGATLVDKRLIIFLMRVHKAEGGLGFAAFGAAVAVIDNPQAEPNDWQIKVTYLPTNTQHVILGSGCAFVERDHLYAFGATEPGKHDVYATRWPLTDIAASKFDDPEWWTGDSTGWIAQSKLKTPPQKCFGDGQTEFTIHFLKQFDRYLEFQATGFGGADLSMRSAAKFTGEWSKLRTIYPPPEKNRAKIMIYAAKAHPELGGADLALTYNTNSFDFAELVNDDSLYYPRFVRLAFPR
jgi:hypothetical protein